MKLGTAIAIDYREIAPSKASRNMYLDKQGEFREDSSRLGSLAAGVPGTVAGLALALEKYGTMRWNEVIEPARRLAAEGFLVSETLSNRIKAAQGKNEMDDFAAKVGEPNSYGLIQGEANSIEPLKRPLSSMTPTVVIHHGKPLLALGTHGGPTITTQVLQVIVNLLDLGMPLDQAIRAPRIHHQYLPDVVEHDQDGLEIGIIRALERMGHTLKVDPGFPQIGDVEAVMLDEKNGGYSGAADPRNCNARAVGY